MDVGTFYARGVVKGDFPAGELVRLAAKRHLDDLKSAKKRGFPYRYDEGKAADVVEFCGFLHHYKGAFSGQVFEPLEWQVFILGSLFGWVEKKTGLRRFRSAYVEVPRKNGKTFMAAAVALYLLVADGEPGAEIYSVATKKDQAKLVWNDCLKMVKKSASLRKHLDDRYVTIHFDKADSFFMPLGSDSTTLDGLNPHGSVKDELHEWPSRGLWDVIDDAYGSREQPLDFSITTAGYNITGICYEIRTHCENILKQEGYDDERQFCYIASVDEEDIEKINKDFSALNDRRLWEKANPCLGVSKRAEYLEDQVAKALKMPGKENAVKNKQFNIWTSAEKKWMDMPAWRKCGGEIDEDSLLGAACFPGMDLATTTDLAAVVYIFPPGPYDEWVILPKFYLPEESPHSGRSSKIKDVLLFWARADLITLTPDDVIDYDFIERDIGEAGEKFDVRSIGYDPWNATSIVSNLVGSGFDMVKMRQGFGTMSSPMKELEKLTRKGKIRHGGNPVLEWMMGNTVAREDANENKAPDKSKSSEKIDGTTATIIGLGVALNETDGGSVYDERGPLVFG